MMSENENEKIKEMRKAHGVSRGKRKTPDCGGGT